jgi:hypothetical protein
VWDGERDLVTTTVAADRVQLRTLDRARGDVGTTAPSVGSIAVPAAAHPWRRVQPGTRLYERQQRERLTRSLTR